MATNDVETDGLLLADPVLTAQPQARYSVAEICRMTKVVALLVFFIAATFVGIASAAPLAPPPSALGLTSDPVAPADPAAFLLAPAPDAPVRDAVVEAALWHAAAPAGDALVTIDGGYLAGIVVALLLSMIGLVAMLWHEVGVRLGLGPARQGRRC